MGDWIWRHHWFVARSPSTALRVYERLEEVGRAMDAGRDSGLVTGVRFGFVSPTVVAATCTAKWGTHQTFQGEVTRAISEPVEVISGDTTQSELAGSIAALDPAYAFAWSQDQPTLDALRLRYPAVRFGAAEVFRLDTDVQDLIYAGLIVAPAIPVAGTTVVVGVACHAHGLIALAHWEYDQTGDTGVEPASLPTRLRAIRTAGHGSWAITNTFDDTKHLPDSYLDRPELAALDRHDALAPWRPPAVRRRWVDDGVASVDAAARQAAAMLIRRFAWRDRAPALVDLMADSSPDVRAAASLALLELRSDGDAVSDALARGLADVDPRVRARCATAIDLLRGGHAAAVRGAMTIDDRDGDDGQRAFDLQLARDAFANDEVNPWADHTEAILLAAGAAAEPWLVAQLADRDARERTLELIERAGPVVGALPAVVDAMLALPPGGDVDDKLALPRALAGSASIEPRLRDRLLALDPDAGDPDDRDELVALQLGAGHAVLRATLRHDAGLPGASPVVLAVLHHASPAMADLAPELIQILERRTADRETALGILGEVWPTGPIPEAVRAVAEDVLIRWLGEAPVEKQAIRALAALAPLGVIGVPVLAKMTTLARPEIAHVAALTLGFLGDDARRALDQRWATGADLPPTVRFALGRIPPVDAATLPALCDRARSGRPPAPGFADRARELAAGLGRGTYWRVRSGSSGPDVVPEPPALAALVRAWSGDPSMKADRVILWADACAAAGDELARLVIALDNAMAATCANPSWITPSAAWIDRALAIAWDGGPPDPAWPDPTGGPGPHDARVGDAKVLFERADGLDPAAALPVLEEAADLAIAAGARRLAERIRFRWLGQLIAANDPRGIAALAEFLAELPPPMLILPQQDHAEHTGWTANYLAWLVHEGGDSKKALPIVDRAVLMSDHDDSAVLDTLARVKLAVGDLDGARAAVRWMQRFAPGAKELPELVRLIPIA